MSTAAPSPDSIRIGNVPLPTPEQLPDDLATLKCLVIELMVTLRAERRDNEGLRHRIDQLLRRIFGPRTERYHPDQALLFPEFTETPASAADSPAAPPPEPDAPATKRRGKPHGRGKPAAELPRRPQHHTLSEAERLCVCGELRIDIGSDLSEQLDWQPASFFVCQHFVHKYLCPRCSKKPAETPMATPTETPGHAAADAAATDATTPTAPTDPATIRVANAAIGPAVISASKPAPPIEKGLPGPGLLAHIIVSKYVDHLPLHRQEKIAERYGVSLSRSTMCDWLAACAALLRPLYDLMVSQVLASAWMHTDDTPVKNQGHEPGTTALARFWVYLGDRAHPYNVFDFTLNRKRDGPQKFLEHYHGYLHADAFSGYDALYLPGPRGAGASIIEVACNAHARRKFHEARGSDLLRSHQALAYYAQLYELERAATRLEFDDDQRWRMRQVLSLQILAKFHAWLIEQRDHVLPKSPMAEAIGYALNNWQALIRYTEAGFLSIDNNVSEREMKRIAIGRKNWLFVGSDNGGKTAAVLLNFTSTCHRLGIEPWTYLKDVFTRLPALPAAQHAELLPDRWQAARQPAVPSDPTASAEPTPGQRPAP